MKRHIDENELYPVYNFHEKWGPEVEVTEHEVAFIEYADAVFGYAQMLMGVKLGDPWTKEMLIEAHSAVMNMPVPSLPDVPAATAEEATR